MQIHPSTRTRQDKNSWPPYPEVATTRSNTNASLSPGIYTICSGCAAVLTHAYVGLLSACTGLLSVPVYVFSSPCVYACLVVTVSVYVSARNIIHNTYSPMYSTYISLVALAHRTKIPPATMTSCSSTLCLPCIQTILSLYLMNLLKQTTHCPTPATPAPQRAPAACSPPQTWPQPSPHCALHRQPPRLGPPPHRRP